MSEFKKCLLLQPGAQYVFDQPGLETVCKKRVLENRVFNYVHFVLYIEN